MIGNKKDTDIKLGFHNWFELLVKEISILYCNSDVKYICSLLESLQALKEGEMIEYFQICHWNLFIRKYLFRWSACTIFIRKVENQKTTLQQKRSNFIIDT